MTTVLFIAKLLSNLLILPSLKNYLDSCLMTLDSICS